jgi:hypothetical protein
MKNAKFNKIMTFGALILFIGLMIIPALNADSINIKNFDDQNSNNNPEGYKLLIISPNRFAYPLENLVDHKIKHNMSTKLITLEEIYSEISEGRDEAEKIKYYIKNSIESWGIVYVLLVGGRKNQFALSEKWWLPVRYVYIEDLWGRRLNEDKYISDLYFADIYDSEGNFSSWDSNNNEIYGEWFDNKSADDIIDLYPDVYVGRLPCRNIFEVKIMVKKIINYEKSKCEDSWFKKMVVVAGDTYPGNSYYEGEFSTQQALENMSDFKAVKLWTSLGTLNSHIDVIKEIYKGCGFLYFAGHSNPTNWGTHPPDSEEFVYGLSVNHMPFLFNGKKLPICVVGGCHTSMFNNSLFHTSWNSGSACLECWSWWLTRKVGGGSIATIGNTALGYGAEDKINPGEGGGGERLEVFFFVEYGKKGTEILGEAWGNAIEEYLQIYPIDWSKNSFEDSALDAKSVQQWVIFGDPSLKIGGYSSSC